MSKIITLSNGILKVSISSYKAEILSVSKNGKEFIWQADSDAWAEHCPIVFPIYINRFKEHFCRSYPEI